MALTAAGDDHAVVNTPRPADDDTATPDDVKDDDIAVVNSPRPADDDTATPDDMKDDNTAVVNTPRPADDGAATPCDANADDTNTEVGLSVFCSRPVLRDVDLECRDSDRDRLPVHLPTAERVAGSIDTEEEEKKEEEEEEPVSYTHLTLPTSDLV